MPMWYQIEHRLDEVARLQIEVVNALFDGAIGYSKIMYRETDGRLTVKEAKEVFWEYVREHSKW